jgi:hypothetical protein
MPISTRSSSSSPARSLPKKERADTRLT